MRTLRHIFTLALVLGATPAGAAVHPIDSAASHATFSVQHALIEHVTGRIPIVTAVVTTAADDLTPTAVDATLDPRHINTGDGDRDGNLQGTDWFDTQKFPTWTFRSSSVAANADGSYAVAGLLTIHGVAVPLVLTTTVSRRGSAAAYHAVTHVDRHAFGMVITRTDVLIGNEITIVLDVQTK